MRRAPAGLVWAGLAVTALFTYLTLRDADFGEVGRALRASEYWWLAPSLAVLAAAMAIRAVRWRYLFARARRPPLRNVAGAMLIGYFFNNVLPARAGEAARVVALNQSARVSRAEIAATVAIERFYDVVSLLLILFVTLPWLPEVTWLRTAGILAIALGLSAAAAVAVLVVFGERAVRILLRPLARLPFLTSERVERVARNVTEGLGGITRARLALAAVLWTTASWVVLAVSYWLLMRGFHLGLSPLAGMLVVVAIGLAMILPSSPAAIGVFEAATVLALGAYGISDSAALSYAVVLHALNFLPFIAAGLVVLHLHGTAVRRERRRALA